jgi:hypothetical protein
MSAEVRWLAEAIPEGQGWASDLGGGGVGFALFWSRRDGAM